MLTIQNWERVREISDEDEGAALAAMVMLYRSGLLDIDDLSKFLENRLYSVRYSKALIAIIATTC